MRIINNLTVADLSPPKISNESIRSIIQRNTYALRCGLDLDDLYPESLEERMARLDRIKESLKQEMVRQKRVKKLNWIEETVAGSVSLAAKSALLVYSMGDVNSYISFLEHRPDIAEEVVSMSTFPIDEVDLIMALEIARSITTAHAARSAIADIEAELGL